MDRLLGENNGQGRIRRKLDQFGELLGLVAGQFNEVSEDIHQLIEVMADNRVDKIGRLEGKQMSKNEKGVAVGQIRRYLSTVMIRSAMMCLLGRMNQ